MNVPNDSAIGPYQGVFQPHWLVRSLNEDPERPVLHLADGTVQRACDVRDIISQYCQLLADRGLRKGARIALLSGNKPDVLHVTHAAMFNEYVLVPLHPIGAVDDYLYVIDDAGIDVLIFEPKAYAARARELKALRPDLKLLSFGPTDLGEDIEAAAAACQPRELQAPNLTGDEVFRLSYSGGTTGKPKAIVGTHRYWMAMMQILLSEWEWPEEIRQLICTPLSHSGAPLFMPALLRGGSMVVLPNFDPVKVMETIQKYRITTVLMVPTMIYALLDHPRLAEFDLSSLRTIFYGASAMSPARLREGIARFGKIFFQFYGQAEAPMSICVLRRSEHDPENPLRMSSCGRPVPWVHVALLDNNGDQVQDGEPGEICVKGPLVMQGYHNKPEMTTEVFSNGWLHTGDVAVRDPGGFMRIVDRKKDMIITGGFNVYPREIEDVLGTHPAVAQCAVIGIPDDRWGESVKAVVVLRTGAQPCGDELMKLVKDKKGAVQAPKSVDFVSSIPLTAVGKPDKKALRATYTQPGGAKP